jgi:hypothetical protein
MRKSHAKQDARIKTNFDLSPLECERERERERERRNLLFNKYNHNTSEHSIQKS